MLHDDDLLMVLAATEQYWPIWPPWQYGALPPNMPTLQASGVKYAAEFLPRMARSSIPSIAAKAWLWLSLCIQQAPKTLQLSRCELSHGALLALYIKTASKLLTSATGTNNTLDEIEAQLIQQRIYLDMGRPRQAWLIVLRATDEALLLRLHRATEERGQGREAAIWNEILRLETTLALILGLPSTIPIPEYDDSGSNGNNPLHVLLHRIQSLIAAVVARNQSPQPSYLVTMQISHKLEACRALMPDSWWNEPPQQGQPFTQLYFHKGLFVICESLDFQAFSAGITLLIRLLSLTLGKRPNDGNNVDQDWSFGKELTMGLRRTASVMQCNVASQAAEVLDLLTQAARGTYAGPDKYNVVLPYFGRVTISLSKDLKTTHLEGLGERQESPQQQPANPPFGTVEFSANPFDLRYSSESLKGELGGDWSSISDIDFSFDWTQMFTFETTTIHN
ncbi:hypothetical protein FCOIX_3143 [Fusarium coicis]|nr:hypothetical protein FCOIX_3143 [Fusarium coicis]